MTLTLGSLGAQAAPPTYGITRITPPAGQSYCQVLGLNDAGQAIGACNTRGFFVWSQATGAQTFSDPNFPDAVFWPTAINNLGVVIGGRYENQQTRNPGFIWDEVNGFRYFAGKVGTFLDARAINDSNEVAGIRAVDDGAFVWKAFRWTEADGMSFLKPSANRRTLATAINNAGQIAGSIENLDSGYTYAVRYEPDGSVTHILPRQRPGTPYALNELGHAAGGMQTPKHGFQAFFWTPEAGVVDIDDRPLRSDESYAQDMNDAGQVVGAMSWVGSGGNIQETVFYWDAATGMRDLMTLLDPNDPLTGQLSSLSAPSGKINADGKIVVDGNTHSGETWPLLLTPVTPLASRH
ncbi:MAG TPA: hypothetical protein VFY73_17370 [Ideonella sp.]|uniref:hypothetical protein n=1 Tax=Ideonella sp. TaxID=1929293 RepID=UPI002E33D511|nr:hypothetical protein [Ideonella sp.]HEX5685796.1 hypothetical protein [Ideonella sp.]